MNDFVDPFRRHQDPKRPLMNERMRDLVERVMAAGSLELAGLAPEDRATATILVARGIVRYEGKRLVPVVMG